MLVFYPVVDSTQLCRAHVTVSINRKKPQVDLHPKIQPFNHLILHPDRNCSALNNLCLFAIFPCGSAQRPIIIYAHQTLPVSEGRPGLPRRCATLYQWPRRNLAGGCGGFLPLWVGCPDWVHPKSNGKATIWSPNSCGVTKIQTQGHFALWLVSSSQKKNSHDGFTAAVAFIHGSANWNVDGNVSYRVSLPPTWS